MYKVPSNSYMVLIITIFQNVSIVWDILSTCEFPVLIVLPKLPSLKVLPVSFPNYHLTSKCHFRVCLLQLLGALNWMISQGNRFGDSEICRQQVYWEWLGLFLEYPCAWVRKAGFGRGKSWTTCSHNNGLSQSYGELWDRDGPKTCAPSSNRLGFCTAPAIR